MSGLEISHRVREKFRKITAKKRLEGWDRYTTSGPLPQLPGFLDLILSASKTETTAVVTAADALLAGKYSALSVDWPAFDLVNIDQLDRLWTFDPVSGQTWPDQNSYTFDIPYRHRQNMGDIKYVWEINRLQILQPLAAAYALTGETQYLHAVERIIDSWHASNPPFRGLGWNSGIELALRAISILIAASLCGAALSGKTVTQIRALLTAHGFWLARYPSRYSSANNHLVAEATAEILLGIALPELAKLEENGRATLTRETPLQILDDGTPAEQSPAYGAFTAELILLAALLSQATGRPLPTAITHRLAKFAKYIAALINAVEVVPNFGDNDEGRVLTLCTHEQTYEASVATCISSYLGDVASQVLQKNSLRGIVFPARLTGGDAAEGLQQFPSGGLTIVRQTHANHKVFIAMDHGPLGYLSIAAHGHADALAVVAAIDDRPLFVDAGTYLYHSGGAWRDWFRGTRCHNTLCLDNADQSIISGPFNWAHKAITKLEATETGVNWTVTASHTGYKKRYGVVHRRCIAATADGFSIADQLIGKTDKTVEISFQLAPGATAKKDGGLIVIRDASGLLARLKFSAAGDVQIASGGEIGIGGWVSQQFGQKTPAPRISWSGIFPDQGLITDVRI